MDLSTATVQELEHELERRGCDAEGHIPITHTPEPLNENVYTCRCGAIKWTRV